MQTRTAARHLQGDVKEKTARRRRLSDPAQKCPGTGFLPAPTRARQLMAFDPMISGTPRPATKVLVNCTATDGAGDRENARGRGSSSASPHAHFVGTYFEKGDPGMGAGGWGRRSMTGLRRTRRPRCKGAPDRGHKVS